MTTPIPLLIEDARSRIRDAILACVTCGKPHPWTDTTRPGDLYSRGTWADPTDGHTYRKRSLGIRDEEVPATVDAILAALTTEPTDPEAMREAASRLLTAANEAEAGR